MNDEEYMESARYASSFSTCSKKQLGCVLKLKDNTIILGTNGPPTPLARCDPCPRVGIHGGLKQNECRAVHAERQVLLIAAKKGYATRGAILYSYMGVPCKDCLLELICAGVSEIVCIRETYYDELSKSILKEWIKTGGIFRIWMETNPQN